MSKFTSIDQLPDEIICAVLSFLDREDTKTAAKVCLRWSIIIRDSLMKNLKYSVLINRSQEFKTIDDFEEGKHVNQKVFGLRIPTKTPVVHQLLKHSDSVKHLSLFQCKMDAKSLCGIVNMFKQTVHLVLDNVEFESGTIGGYEESAGLRLNLPKLKHLEIIDSDSKLCDIFRNSTDVMSKLEQLNVDLSYSNGLENVLMKAPNLEDLTVKKDAILFARIMLDYPFKLKKLSMIHMYERELRSYINLPVEFQRFLPNDRLITFLLNQADTLKELTVYNCPKTRMMNFIASDLKVETLSLGITACDYDVDLFDGIVKNRYLKELNIYGQFGCHEPFEYVKQIIEQFPAIERLTFYNSQEEAAGFAYMISSLLKIKVSIETSDDDSFNSIPDVEFYIRAQNHEEIQLMLAGKEAKKTRMTKLREAEEREAIREKMIKKI